MTRSLPINCAFENSNWCGWSYDEGDYSWSRGRDPTPSAYTGPDVDHTTGSGYYAFIESSDTTYQHNMGPFTLESPDLSGGSGGVQIDFYYSMYGSTMGTLQLDIFDGAEWITQWSLSGNPGGGWNLATVEVTMAVVRVRFVGTTGDGWYSDMALDDVAITSAPIAPTAAPTLSPPPTTSARPTSNPTEFRLFEARTWTELDDALQHDSAAVNVSSDIVFSQRIRLVNGQDVTAYCNDNLIAASSVGYCATLTGGESTGLFWLASGSCLRLVGLRVTDGFADVPYYTGGSDLVGAAFYLSGASEAYLSGCTVTNHFSSHEGAAFYLSESEVHLSACTVNYNYADLNGGAFSLEHDSFAYLHACTVNFNGVASIYGGVSAYSGVGGAFSLSGSVAQLVSCTVSKNVATVRSCECWLTKYREGEACAKLTRV